MPEGSAAGLRDVPLGLLENARDLGGYATADGRRVRWGRLFRAASLHEADEDTAADWHALGLRTVVDLRRDDERSRRGTVSIDLHPAGDRHLPVMREIFLPAYDVDSQPDEYLAACYIEILGSGQDAIRELFALLSEEKHLPLALFCAAGKDRTGTMVALVLAALGVDEETICDDYALSGERVSAMVQRKRASGDVDRDPMVDQHPTILHAPRGAMRLFLEHLRTHTPGVEGYLAGIGVSTIALEAVRAALLEPR
ncbi:tyrosine-protein phosphatase [Aeromicrobium sp.]|uniref:tyrosine-protein phosphatase n=1 Tax=Aeromicrobium sp. TaxID=1871063 RepID=UPI001985DCF2|nr:tyrosine-protein phosphatase [Aeromicrobium sp.]MBC7632207.1 tyrosine-protein phosphatase [Aeromicrobium sp.]